MRTLKHASVTECYVQLELANAARVYVCVYWSLRLVTHRHFDSDSEYASPRVYVCAL